jgi:hypothetical protein
VLYQVSRVRKISHNLKFFSSIPLHLSLNCQRLVVKVNPPRIADYYYKKILGGLAERLTAKTCLTFNSSFFLLTRGMERFTTLVANTIGSFDIILNTGVTVCRVDRNENTSSRGVLCLGSDEGMFAEMPESHFGASETTFWKRVIQHIDDVERRIYSMSTSGLKLQST